jgi:diguanylate cyclase (GGDEF)-like protein
MADSDLAGAPMQEKAAPASVSRLAGEADALRAELAQLRQDLANAQREFGQERGSRLLEANERLVLGFLQAEALAESAASDLDQLTRSGQRDLLTDTPNRALMLDRLQNAIASAMRRGTRLAVIFLDLDHFKQVNDTLGHAIGDEVLRLVARRLEAVVRNADTVSRHSGDEFLVLLEDVVDAADALPVVGRMLAAVGAPSRIAGHELNLAASLGVALYPEDGTEAATLIASADAAMYRAKKRGRARFEFHGAPRSDADTAELFPDENAPAPDAPVDRSRPHRDPVLSDLREANEQLVLAALDSQKLEVHTGETHRRQIHFLAMVAHELRDPLTPIRMAAEVLTRTRADDPVLLRQQQIIKRQVAHMSRLVDDLLDGSRASTGKFRLHRTRIDLLEVVHLAVETCRPALDSRGQRLTLQLPAVAPTVHADAVRLAQVFGNLLDNASKYTLAGGAITLVVEPRGREVSITISDNGIGITPEALPRIFDLFVQDEHAVAVNDGGLGIGLAVVRNLVEGHDGAVVASSAGKNLGSEFVVTLPMTRP